MPTSIKKAASMVPMSMASSSLGQMAGASFYQ
jgi:hypothetical protein